MLETKKIDAFDKRKQRESSRKFDKQVADMRKQEKSSRVKQDIAAVSSLRRDSGASSKAGGGKRSEQIKEAIKGSRGSGEKSKKRQAMVRWIYLFISSHVLVLLFWLLFLSTSSALKYCVVLGLLLVCCMFVLG